MPSATRPATPFDAMRIEVSCKACLALLAIAKMAYTATTQLELVSMAAQCEIVSLKVASIWIGLPARSNGMDVSSHLLALRVQSEEGRAT